VPAGTPGHRVLLTNLVNHVQPLIRYELSDSLVMADGPHPGGMPYSRIVTVDGRSDDIVMLPALAGGQAAVHPTTLRASGAAPTPIEVTPVAEIPRERGPGAKLKLIRSTVRPATD
jgi:phenylacetate-coenzyme A ligase PaaK-like adenylate-forming protein